MLSYEMYTINLVFFTFSQSIKSKNIKKNSESSKGVSFYSSKLKASITLEATFVVPIFLFFVFTVMMALEIVRFQSGVFESLQQTEYEYGVQSFFVKYEGEAAMNISTRCSELLNHGDAPYFCMRGMVEYNDLSESDIGTILIEANYEIKPFIYWIPIRGNFRDSVFGHEFTGYIPFDTSCFEEDGETYVYITESGSKYHLYEYCNALSVQVEADTLEAVLQKRSIDGSKYYPCERCAYGVLGLVYFTKSGNRYHGENDCPSLKRTVYVVSLSEALSRGYEPCKRCS